MLFRWRLLLFLCFTIAVIASVFTFPKIPQDQAYHAFTDRRSLFGIPNFLDVASNAPFLIAGLWGLIHLIRRKQSVVFQEGHERWPYITFFLGIALAGVASAYYHWAPDNERLVWDRIPMAIAFMGILAGVIGDRIGSRAGKICLFPMLAAGIFSVLYWYLGELKGSGDLRPYVMVQFFTLAAIPLLMILFPARYSHSGWLLVGGTAYILAKIFEAFDRQIFTLLHVSGHTLKHIMVSMTALCVIEMIRRRSSIDPMKL
jgi:hypothetical protein